MGLDMYAFKTKETIPEVDFGTPETVSEIPYWRKHPNLHGWMEKLYFDKGGTSETFNCDHLRLDVQDIDALENALDHLPEATGFFFGESRPEEKGDDLKFVQAAREALRDGYNVFYTSWW